MRKSVLCLETGQKAHLAGEMNTETCGNLQVSDWYADRGEVRCGGGEMADDLLIVLPRHSDFRPIHKGKRQYCQPQLLS